jgi:gliding motility-associated-like protein
LGNTGFTSQYLYNSVSGFNAGVYNVGNNLPAWHPAMPACTDHTGPSGNGNMMMVNGDVNPNTNVWSTTVPVTPNTNYNFSSWVQTITTINPAQLQFSINGILIGAPFTANVNSCIWDRFFANWNSGNNTSANIAIVNMNTGFSGNDFALDDISFAPVTIQRDSVKIIVDTPKVNATGATAVCPGIPAQLNASGAATYSWTPATGLSNTGIANPIATPASTTSYIVSGTTIHGCVATAPPVTIAILAKPVITKTNDSTICKNNPVQLFATGGNIYSWTPTATLNNPNIANPIATPTANITRYYVTVTNTAVNSCTNRDSVKITLQPTPVFTVSASQNTCLSTNAQLNASGGDKFLWSPATLVSNPLIANPLTNTAGTTTYSVTITESVCNVSQMLSTVVTVLPTPSVSASKSNDIDCSNNSSNLIAIGATKYVWTPVTGLNNSNIANPIATPIITTQYIVKGLNSFGCAGYDTVVVAVTTNGTSGYYMPNSFTPNGDGKNDCFGIKYWGIIKDLKFIIYNRYGEQVFVTTDPNQCWDGRYKSEKPEPGNYVYYIKATTACGPVEKKGNVILMR